MERRKHRPSLLETRPRCHFRKPQKYGGHCFSLAQILLSDFRDAEECVSDTFLGTWNAFPPPTVSSCFWQKSPAVLPLTAITSARLRNGAAANCRWFWRSCGKASAAAPAPNRWWRLGSWKPTSRNLRTACPRGRGFVSSAAISVRKASVKLPARTARPRATPQSF